MPRFFDDYSNTYLTHDSAAGRKQQRRGWKFRENFKLHYEKHLPEWRAGPMGLASAQQAFLRTRRHPATGKVMEGDGMVPPLPEGWVEELDEATGVYYYVNEESGKRSWVRPGFRPPMGGPGGMGGPPPPMMGGMGMGGPPPPMGMPGGGPPPPMGGDNNNPNNNNNNNNNSNMPPPQFRGPPPQFPPPPPGIMPGGMPGGPGGPPPPPHAFAPPPPHPGGPGMPPPPPHHFPPPPNNMGLPPPGFSKPPS